MNRWIVFLLACCFSTVSFSQNAIPEVLNLEAQVDANAQTVTLNFELSDAENDLLSVSLQASSDQRNYGIDVSGATGDLGADIPPGPDKTISWSYANAPSGPLYLRLIADDGVAVDIQAIVDQVDSLQLIENLAFLEGIRHRNAGPVLLEAVKDSLEGRFVRYGLKATRQAVPYGGYTGENIVGTTTGIQQWEETYLLDAHFDSVSNSPGADDNASGTAGVLEALRVLSPYLFEKTIRYVGFDLEEEGLVGATVYAANLPADETFMGMLNLEMIGYYRETPNTQTFPTGFNLLFPDQYAEIEADGFRGNFITNVGTENNAAWMETYSTHAATYVPALKVIDVPSPGTGLAVPDLLRSDHAPFWALGLPAVMLTDGSEFRYPYYHTPNDVAANLNFTFMQQVVQGAVATLAEEAGIRHASATEVVVDVPVSASEVDALEQIEVQYVESGLRLLLPEDVLPIQMELIQSTGQILKVETLNTNRHFLSRKDWPAGVYFLRFTAKEGIEVRQVLFISQ